MSKLTCTLIVDDDETSNFLTERVFKKLGASEKLFTARNRLEALALLGQHCPGPDCPTLILLDINMPVMNGFEFLEAFKQLQPVQRQSVVIIMLSSSDSPRDLEKVRQAGIADLVKKPLTHQALQQIMVRYFK